MRGRAPERAAEEIHRVAHEPWCVGIYLSSHIEDKLLGIPDCDEAIVEIVWDPPWTPHMMSGEARKKLNLDE